MTDRERWPLGRRFTIILFIIFGIWMLYQCGRMAYLVTILVLQELS